MLRGTEGPARDEPRCNNLTYQADSSSPQRKKAADAFFPLDL